MHECDIYAVSATFYHLLTNRTPVDSTKRSLEIWEGNADPLPNPCEINAEIPPIISAWLLKALEIERDNRFSSALEMHEALKRAMAEAKSANPEIKRPENLAQVETSKLITKEDLRIQSPTEPLLENKPATTQPIDIFVPDTQPSVNDSAFVPVADTIPSDNISQSEVTGTSYLKGILPEERKAENKDSSCCRETNSERFGK